MTDDKPKTSRPPRAVDTKPKPRPPKPKPKPKLARDQATWGGARVHSARVDLATAVRMQAAGYRVETKHGDGSISVYGDAVAFESWKGVTGV